MPNQKTMKILTSKEIRDLFIQFFTERGHVYAPPSAIVNSADTTLMFTNAGMNQFKDIFLGNAAITHRRMVNSQICLRVSGKHNDIEEVGLDSYHHTMFEMLGNWSMDDYFKRDAILFAWELLTTVYNLPPERLYVTVFEGDSLVPKDEKAIAIWSEVIPDKKHILLGNKHDNFWEMGTTGPCGPCTEIHIDLRDENEKKHTPGKNLVNNNHPEVIEIWNIVFMQYQRCDDGALVPLTQHFIDTGMGLERLVRVIQGKKSNYDTDLFTEYIKHLEEMAGKRYGQNNKIDIAMRVIADHIRAITMTIGEGLIPSNIKEGYVIRRLLRRAVRYGYTFMDFDKPFLYKLVPLVIDNMAFFKHNTVRTVDKIEAVILQEEEAFFKTLKTGTQRLQDIIDKNKTDNAVISGKEVFELYDTYGFPSDLTEVILHENDMTFNKEEFNKALEEQKTRSREANNITYGDWLNITEGIKTCFVGYDKTECEGKIVKYRHVKNNDNGYYQLVFSETPFYGESGGQRGDTGVIYTPQETIDVFDTKKEFGDIVHCVKQLPKDIKAVYELKIDLQRRERITANHSCTHILHAVLQEEYGPEVRQCGSMVDDNKLRFDFNYTGTIDVSYIEQRVNAKIQEGLVLCERREVSLAEAQKENAIGVFKYEDKVRVVAFGDFSKELCCGTHVHNTKQISSFKILKCKSIASGIKRIEAITKIN
ncbi:MAG: alanine--tRNA ligase [Cytophagales bacterium]|nr:alanine--tRNA ligase [Cytophagales bacterium]